MLKNKQILKNIQATKCPKCGESLSTAQIDTVFKADTSYIAHAVCTKCSTSSMITVTLNGSGTVPIYSDLSGKEFKKFLRMPGISYDDVLDLHLVLKKESIWNLLHKKEK